MSDLTGSSPDIEDAPGERHVQYLWYDMFNVSYGEHMDYREMYYGYEVVVSDVYPHYLMYLGAPAGNYRYYTNMRLNVSAGNLPEVNMNENPWFFPLFGTSRGGIAVLEWDLYYPGYEEVATRWGSAVSGQYDGWLCALEGDIVLDRDGAMAVLGLSSLEFDDFSTWWASNSAIISSMWLTWLTDQGRHPYDIWCMYEFDINFLGFSLDATKSGDYVTISFDSISWGVECLMARWLRYSFMETEWWYDDFHMNALIDSSSADIDIGTVVANAAFAYESSEDGSPCWRWHGMLGDYMPSRAGHPNLPTDHVSDYDPYADDDYILLAPGNLYYDTWMVYDYTPGAQNLSENEYLVFEWPAGIQLFKVHVNPGEDADEFAEMQVGYSEPMDTDLPGQVTTDLINRTIAFEGPIDFWSWSKDQVTHQFLSDEWDRIGLMPYGMPRIEFGEIPPVPQCASFEITGVESPIKVGAFTDVIVTAIDQYGQPYADYVGTVRFSSNDSGATLPDDYTFTIVDVGVRTFEDAVAFSAIGIWNLTVEDAIDSSITGSCEGIEVSGASVATWMSLSGPSDFVPKDVPQDLMVEVYDQYGVLFADYLGTVHFFHNGTAGDIDLPPDYTFVLGDAGAHTFVGGATFHTEGLFTVACSDVSDPSVSAWITNLMVVSDPPAIEAFVVSGIADMSVGETSGVHIAAMDQYGSVFEDYAGTITFSTDAAAGTYSLPPDYSFIPLDAGEVYLEGVSFSEPGVYCVTVADVAVPEATGAQTGIVISQVVSELTHRLYGMFEEPFSEVWTYRFTGYAQDYILSNTSGHYTHLYDPTQLTERGIIFAPYRWNTDARNVTSVSVDHPEFMPVIGPGNVSGASAKLDLYFQYLNWSWWYDYWVPTWSTAPEWSVMGQSMLKQTNDGYYLGVVYNITLNREAAYSWFNMSQSDDPDDWWTANASAYRTLWINWILNEGKKRLDIYCGYDDTYYALSTAMRMHELPNGDVSLTIAHHSWGYEVLMARWLTESMLCVHEPYWEDLSLHADYGPSFSDVNLDGVGRYNLHAVKANESSTNEAAWVWEPARIDYVPSFSTHSSDYDPWATKEYQSWNAGDTCFGQPVFYENTPGWFNLSVAERLIIQLPTRSDVVAYDAEPPPPEIVYEMAYNDNYSWFQDHCWFGNMSLGFWITDPAGGGADLDSMYDPISNTLTIVGPQVFDQVRWPDGYIYHGAPWIEFNVTPGPGPSDPPVADAGFDQTVLAGVNVLFDGSKSSSYYGIVNYTWTFDHLGSPVTLYGMTPTFMFLVEDSYLVTLTVTDGFGQVDSDEVLIVIAGVIPEFNGALIPALLLMATIVLGIRWRRRP